MGHADAVASMILPTFFKKGPGFRAIIDERIKENYETTLRESLQSFGFLVEAVAVERTEMPLKRSHKRMRCDLKQMFSYRTAWFQNDEMRNFFQIYLIDEQISGRELDQIEGNKHGRLAKSDPYGAALPLFNTCVISTPRISQDAKKAPRGSTAMRRCMILAYVIRHETGHLLGLRHHPGENKGASCVMHESADFDTIQEWGRRRTGWFCRTCTAWLKQLRSDAENGSFLSYAGRLCGHARFEKSEGELDAHEEHCTERQVCVSHPHTA